MNRVYFSITGLLRFSKFQVSKNILLIRAETFLKDHEMEYFFNKLSYLTCEWSTNSMYRSPAHITFSGRSKLFGQNYISYSKSYILLSLVK